MWMAMVSDLLSAPANKYKKRMVSLLWDPLLWARASPDTVTLAVASPWGDFPTEGSYDPVARPGGPAALCGCGDSSSPSHLNFFLQE